MVDSLPDLIWVKKQKGMPSSPKVGDLVLQTENRTWLSMWPLSRGMLREVNSWDRSQNDQKANGVNIGSWSKRESEVKRDWSLLKRQVVTKGNRFISSGTDKGSAKNLFKIISKSVSLLPHQMVTYPSEIWRGTARRKRMCKSSTSRS